MIKLCEYIYAQPMGNRSTLYIDTGIIPTKDTVFRFKCIGAGYETGDVTVGEYYNDNKDYRLFFFGSNGSTLMFDYNTDRIQNANWGGVPNGQEVDITAGNYYVYDNIKGENICTGATQSQDPMDGRPIKVCVGQIYAKSLEIWEGQTKVFDGKAAYDDSTNNIGLFDSVSNTLVYNPNLSMGKGADSHILSVTPSILKFESTGGTLSFTVAAETGWTCTTPSAFTISTTAGTSGDTVVTVTAPNYTGSTRIDEDITLTDDDGYTANVHLRQKPVSTGVQSNIYLGGTNIEVLKLGNKAVESIYLGDVQVFAQGEFVGVKISPSSVDFYVTETIKTIKVKSSEAWTLSTDANWLTFSQTSGDSGVSVVTVTSTSGDSALTAVICATTANYSASTTVTYTPIDTNIYDWCKLNATSANTGYRITDIDDEIEFVFAYNNGGQGAWGVFLSDLLTGDAFDANVHLSKTTSATKMRVSDYGMNNSSIDISNGVVYTYIGNKNGATLNGTAITLAGTAELKNQGTITINGQSEGWGAVYLEFRRLVIRNSGVEKLHIVPYMNNGTACLKDLVSGNIINATIASIGNDD